LAPDASLPSFNSLGRGNNIQDEASDALDHTDHNLRSYGHREGHLPVPESIQAERKLCKQQMDTIIREYGHSAQYVAFEAGSVAIFDYSSILIPRLRECHNIYTALEFFVAVVSGLERPNKDRDRAVERAWNGLMKIYTKETRKSLSRREFDAGVNSAMRIIIRLKKFIDSACEDCPSKGLGPGQAENLLRKALEVEFDLIEQERRIQEPFAKLEALGNRLLLLDFLGVLYKREDKRRGQKANLDEKR
jgi:hypothetical protein